MVLYEKIFSNYFYFSKDRYSSFFDKQITEEYNKNHKAVGVYSARRKGYMAGFNRQARQAKGLQQKNREKRNGKYRTYN